jgi:hypothetical protein
LSVEPGGQRADGKARIGSVQTAGTSICAGEEGLALEAAFIGGPTYQMRSSVVRAVRTMVHCKIAQDQSAYECQLCARGASVVGFC